MKRKTTFWIIVAVVILAALLLFFFNMECKQDQLSGETIRYQNPILRIKFNYPARWKAKSSGLIQGYPTQYTGEDGFFVVNAIPKKGSLIETVRHIIAEDPGIYGVKSSIEEQIINSKIGYFIYPDTQFVM